jgi:hypothetical protein
MGIVCLPEWVLFVYQNGYCLSTRMGIVCLPQWVLFVLPFHIEKFSCTLFIRNTNKFKIIPNCHWIVDAYITFAEKVENISLWNSWSDCSVTYGHISQLSLEQQSRFMDIDHSQSCTMAGKYFCPALVLFEQSNCIDWTVCYILSMTKWIFFWYLIHVERR